METIDENNRMMRPRHQLKTTFVGIIIVIFGLLYMLRNMYLINEDTWRLIFSWPMLLVAIGVVNIGDRKYSWGLLLITVGVLFLADRFYPYQLMRTYWPVIIILVGLSLIFSKSFRSRHLSRWNHWQNPNQNNYQTEDLNMDGDYIDETAFFGGVERSIHSQNFKGGKIVSIFGGSKIDLTQCQLAPGSNSIEMTAIFGGSTLIIPNDWNVKLESFNAFGGFSDKRRNVNVDYSKLLIIKGSNIFGGGELKSY